jgi:hypothetical protein
MVPLGEATACVYLRGACWCNYVGYTSSARLMLVLPRCRRTDPVGMEAVKLAIVHPGVLE